MSRKAGVWRKPVRARESDEMRRLGGGAPKGAYFSYVTEARRPPDAAGRAHKPEATERLRAMSCKAGDWRKPVRARESDEMQGRRAARRRERTFRT